MSYITSLEYTSITGEAAPADFDILAAMADDVIDRETNYGFVGRNLASLPIYIAGRLKNASAYQVQYLGNMGGVAAANSNGMQSMSLGNYSYSTGNTKKENQVSPAAAVELPILRAYVNGLRKEDA